MLGKGLESLIPKKGSPSSDGSSDVSPNDTRELPREAAAPPRSERGEGTHDTHDTLEVAPLRRAPHYKPGKEESIFHIEVAKIRPNPFQPRRHFDEGALRDLAASIRDFGFLQPLVVTKKETETPQGIDVVYELIAGERRWLAAKQLGLEHVPAMIRIVDEDRERLQMAVIENLQRENLNPIEVARAFARLQDEFRLTQREIAARLGKSREVIANGLRLLDLPAAVQHALERGEISESHGRLLLAVPDPAAQEKLFRDLLEHRLSTRELKQRVEALREAKKQPHASQLSPELAMLQERLSAELGAPVQITRSGATGKILINFYSDEELQGIIQKLGGGEQDDIP